MKGNLISVVTPVYNEEEGIPFLFDRLKIALEGLNYEILAVNDGSKDNSWKALKKAASMDGRIKVINFRRNFGQTAAINAGIQYSKGEIIVLIDSDLENDPAEIPLLLQKMEEGYDVVSGWRKDRWKGSFLRRKLPSLLANSLISNISGVKLHDYGCTLKAYKRDIIQEVKLYGQMHRFIPVYCKWQGGKVAEIPVSYQARMFGQSNYGLFRIYKVVLDLLLIRFLDKFMNRPMHFFGGFGILSFVISFLLVSLALYYKFMGLKDLVQTPLLTVASMFFIVSVLMVLMGLLAEILMRTYYESQNKFPFSVKEKINISK